LRAFGGGLSLSGLVPIKLLKRSVSLALAIRSDTPLAILRLRHGTPCSRSAACATLTGFIIARKPVWTGQAI
jgi:hypothetical protein